MAYVDGFVIPLPRANIERYKEIAKVCSSIWMEHGATRYRECIADDVEPGKLTSFPRAVLLEEDEVVVFSWIEYPSRAVRDACNEKVMKDPRMQAFMVPENSVFDGKRLVYGGFETVVEA